MAYVEVVLAVVPEIKHQAVFLMVRNFKSKDGDLYG